MMAKSATSKSSGFGGKKAPPFGKSGGKAPAAHPAKGMTPPKDAPCKKK